MTCSALRRLKTTDDTGDCHGPERVPVRRQARRAVARLTLLFMMLLAALGTGLLLSVSAAKAEDHAKDKAFLQDAIRKMDAAGVNKDADGYVAFTHPDFVNVNQFGQETVHGREERREKILRLFTRVMSLSEVTTVTGIVFSKGEAFVSESGVTHVTLSINGQDAELVDRDTFRDLWVKSGGGWLEKRSRTLTAVSTLNGRPLPPRPSRPDSAPPAKPAARAPVPVREPA